MSRQPNWRPFRDGAVILFCLAMLGVTVVGNLYRSYLYHWALPVTQYVYGPLNFYQYGWGMYSFNLTKTQPLRYGYEQADGTIAYEYSPYGFGRNPKRTVLGNLDVAVANRSGYSAQGLARYLCKEKGEAGEGVRAVRIERAAIPIPQLSQPFQPLWDGVPEHASFTVVWRQTCSIQTHAGNE